MRAEGLAKRCCASCTPVDPEAAARLHPADEKRIIRALEVWQETGRTITEHNRETQKIPPRYAPVWLGLDFTTAPISTRASTGGSRSCWNRACWTKSGVS